MKPDRSLTSRYADLLTDPSDDALHHLVQELDTVYTAPARPVGLSWTPVAWMPAERQQELLPPQTLNPETPLVRLRPNRGRKRVFLAFAAIVAVALISATLLTILGASGSQRKSTTQTAQFAADALLLQELLQNKATPANIRNLVQSGQFTQLHITNTTDPGHVDIQEAYADANNLVIAYTIDTMLSTCQKQKVPTIIVTQKQKVPAIATPEPCNVGIGLTGLTVTTSDGQMFPENAERVNMGPEPASKNPRYAVLAYYDASSIQGNPKHLNVTVSLAREVSPSQPIIGTFTVPFHADKTVIAVNQTATSHGDALTLEQAVITPTEIRFNNASTPFNLGVGLFPTELSIAGKSYAPNPFPADSEHPDTYGWFGSRSSHFVSFYDSLQRQTGTWIVTEWARVVTGTSLKDSHVDTWTFTFTAS